MATTLTISVSSQDLAYLKENLGLSPSKIFRSAMFLHKSMNEFLDVYEISDFKHQLDQMREKILFLQKEIERRQVTIDSLQDVLEQKTRELRRI